MRLKMEEFEIEEDEELDDSLDLEEEEF